MRIGNTRPTDPSGDPDRVMRWRRDRLLTAGFPPDLADQLAHARTTDLHALLDLVDRGCPPVLAARILAPIDDQPAQC